MTFIAIMFNKWQKKQHRMTLSNRFEIRAHVLFPIQFFILSFWPVYFLSIEMNFQADIFSVDSTQTTLPSNNKCNKSWCRTYFTHTWCLPRCSTEEKNLHRKRHENWIKEIKCHTSLFRMCFILFGSVFIVNWPPRWLLLTFFRALCSVHRK